MHEQAHHTSTRSLLSFSSSSSSSSESITLAVTPPVKVGKLKTSEYVARLDEVRRPTLVLPPTAAAGGVGGPHVSALPRRRRKASPNAVATAPAANSSPSTGSARTRPSTRPIRKRRPTVSLGRNVSLGFADSDVEDEELERGWDVVLRVVLDEDEVVHKGKGKEAEAREEEEVPEPKVTRFVVPASKAANDDGVPILQGDDVRRALERVSNALAVRGVLDTDSATPAQPASNSSDSTSSLPPSSPTLSRSPTSLPQLSRSPTSSPNLPTILILAPPSRPTDGLALALCVMTASYPRHVTSKTSNCSSRPLLPTFLSAIQELAKSSSSPSSNIIEPSDSTSSPTTTDLSPQSLPPPHTFSTPALLLMHLHDMGLFAESEEVEVTPLQREAERERQRFRGCLSAEGVEWIERLLSA